MIKFFLKNLLCIITIITLFSCESFKQVVNNLPDTVNIPAKRDTIVRDREPNTPVYIPPVRPVNNPTTNPNPPIKKQRGESQKSTANYDPDGLPVNRDSKIAKEEQKYFPDVYLIENDVTVIHNGLSKAQLDYIKNIIIATKKDFFEMFGLSANEENAENDFTTGVIITVVNNDDIYRYAGEKFYETTVHTDNDYNAGICMENNPERKDNKARILIRIDNKNDPEKFEIVNLSHEYMHYLDMRYNWASVGFEPNDWWMEGLAEYVGNPQSYEDALKNIKKKKISFYKILKEGREGNENDEASTIKYDGGHLVIAFLFEKHIDDINTFTEMIRYGDYDKYNKWVTALDKKYGKEFKSWVASQK